MLKSNESGGEWMVVVVALNRVQHGANKGRDRQTKHVS